MIWRVLAAVAVLTLAGPALAGVECGDAKEVLAHLKDKYGEIPYLAGMAGNGAPLTVTISPAGTWTLLVAGDESHLCYIGAGKALGRPA